MHITFTGRRSGMSFSGDIKEREMEITKVFTKYDRPFKVIHVPYFKDELVANDLNENTPFLPSAYTMGCYDLKPIRREKGLCGVKFITYGQELAYEHIRYSAESG